jgi:hypothetical protein
VSEKDEAREAEKAWAKSGWKNEYGYERQIWDDAWQAATGRDVEIITKLVDDYGQSLCELVNMGDATIEEIAPQMVGLRELKLSILAAIRGEK